MAMKSYDLYGARSLALGELRAAVEAVLAIELEKHESGYLGGDYFLGGDLRGEHVVIQRNHVDDGDEAEVAEPEFAHYPVLLQVNATVRGDALKLRLLTIVGVDFLRRSVP
jgi:hypothetical protein